MTTIVSQIETTEKAVVTCEERLDKIDRAIRLKELSEDEIKGLLAEEQVVKKRLKECEKQLKSLRKENGKNTVVSVFILGLIALLYFLVWAN